MFSFQVHIPFSLNIITLMITCITSSDKKVFFHFPFMRKYLEKQGQYSTCIICACWHYKHVTMLTLAFTSNSVVPKYCLTELLGSSIQSHSNLLNSQKCNILIHAHGHQFSSFFLDTQQEFQIIVFHLEVYFMPIPSVRIQKH